MSLSQNTIEESDYVAYYLPESKVVVVNMVVLVSSTLSLFGSISICYLVFRAKKTNEMYHRLMLGLSISDILFTVGCLLQPFLIPQETGRTLALGNRGTCTAIGFLIVFILSSIWYNFCLSAYYLLIIRYQKTDKEISKVMEPYIHIIAFIVAILIGSLHSIDGGLNLEPIAGFCQPHPYPQECYSFFPGAANDECTRGKNFHFIHYSAMLFSITSINGCLLCTWLVFWTVRQRQSANYRSEFDIGGANEAKQKRRLLAVRNQALCYTAVVANGMFWNTLLVVVFSFIKPEALYDNYFYFFTLLFCYLFCPLNGFINWWLYIRTRIMRWKDANQPKSWLWSYQQVLTGIEPPPPKSKRSFRLVDNPNTWQTVEGTMEKSDAGQSSRQLKSQTPT